MPKASIATLAPTASFIDIRNLAKRHRPEAIRSLRHHYFKKELAEDKLDLIKGLSGVLVDWMGVAALARHYTDRHAGKYIFRGQSFPYPLISAVGRRKSRRDAITGADIGYSAQGERWIFDQFVLRGLPHLKHEPKTDFEWLAVAQHHGLPTRLLDWTESFLVAALFAVSAAGVEGPSTLYACPRPQRVSRESSPFKLRTPGLYQPPDISPRITAQRGLFTAHPRPHKPFVPDGLEQWLIPKSACFNIKKQLHLCGLNEAVVYPDLEGLGRYLSWRYKRSRSISLE